MKTWFLRSWQQYPYRQAPPYADKQGLDLVVKKLSMQAPLVTEEAILQLRKKLCLAEQGKAFIIQGGDCAESFKDLHATAIERKLDLLCEMRKDLTQKLRTPVLCIGRIAGQYAKPRSVDFETRDGQLLPCYRGDMINSAAFSASARQSNPALLLEAYQHAKLTLNQIANRKDEAAFYTSHEALHLDYEQALTRQGKQGLWFNLSTHLPWIGMRTAFPDGAHVELLRGVHNPIGIKIGPDLSAKLLQELLLSLNPNKEKGRILLFTRLGAKAIEHKLPPIIQAVQEIQSPVTWSCDPMHGNTEVTTDGIKTRHFNNILSELEQTITIHQQSSSHLGGVHFELTGEPVTECLGGPQNLQSGDLTKAYHSLVDPRLNYQQSIEITKQLGNMISRTKVMNSLNHSSQIIRGDIRSDTMA